MVTNCINNEKLYGSLSSHMSWCVACLQVSQLWASMNWDCYMSIRKSWSNWNIFIFVVWVNFVKVTTSLRQTIFSAACSLFLHRDRGKPLSTLESCVLVSDVFWKAWFVNPKSSFKTEIADIPSTCFKLSRASHFWGNRDIGGSLEPLSRVF